MTTLASAGMRSRALLKEHKQLVTNGEITVKQVLALKPEPLRGISVAELVKLLPWVGAKRLARFGERAALHGVNLLVSVGECGDATATWVVHALETIDEPERVAISEEGRLRERLQRAELERDLVLQRLEEAERAIRGCQLVLPTQEAERRAERLVEAIERHRLTVTDPGSSGPSWATADETLWAVLDEVKG